MTIAVEERIGRLNAASARRIIEPDQELPGHVGPGQVIPDELLSVAGLGLDLTPEQKAQLSREEVSSIAEMGIRFEAVLTAGFALQIATGESVRDPRVVYLLHEIGEESRHSRLFVRLLDQLDPKTRNPISGTIAEAIMRQAMRRIINLPALLYTLVLAGEEIPDLFQKKAGEHPDTDPFIREVNRYHRLEESRHLSFARAVLPEIWASASLVERLAVRRVAPIVIRVMFDTLVHPGVYGAIDMPAWKTWREVNRSSTRVAFRYEAVRPVLKALLDGGVIRPGRVNSQWQKLCGVDAGGAARSG